jgi:hypothetical protein
MLFYNNCYYQIMLENVGSQDNWQNATYMFMVTKIVTKYVHSATLLRCKLARI